MMTSMEGQITPGNYLPLRFTFLIWVMVIVGGSGNNWGAVLGGLLIGWLYLAVEFLGPQMMNYVLAALPAGELKNHLQDTAAHMRLLTLGVVLLVVLRFAPRGLIPRSDAPRSRAPHAWAWAGQLTRKRARPRPARFSITCAARPLVTPLVARNATVTAGLSLAACSTCHDKASGMGQHRHSSGQAGAGSGASAITGMGRKEQPAT